MPGADDAEARVYCSLVRSRYAANLGEESVSRSFLPRTATVIITMAPKIWDVCPKTPGSDKRPCSWGRNAANIGCV